MFAVYAMTGRLGLSKGSFAALALVITVALVEYHWFVPGVDALIAASITMALAKSLLSGTSTTMNGRSLQRPLPI